MIYADGIYRLLSSREAGGKLVAVFYCRCKNKKRVWGEFWWKPDEDRHQWVFFDDDRGSATYGESVTNCSGCGEQLHRGALTPA